MSNDKFDSLKCPNCGHDLLKDTKKKWNPRKRITELRLKRSSTINRLLTECINLIKKNIPSENDSIKEYYFLKNIEKSPDIVIRVGIHRFMESYYYLQNKGFNYLSKIIEYTETNSKRQLEIERKKLGTLPKPQSKEDFDEYK